jgi:hypothetical protein
MANSNMPDQFILQPTPYSPNSSLPVLLYRNVLPDPCTEESATAFLTANAWEKRVSFVYLYRTLRHAADGLPVI